MKIQLRRSAFIMLLTVFLLCIGTLIPVGIQGVNNIDRNVYAAVETWDIGTNCKAELDDESGILTISASTSGIATIRPYVKDIDWPWNGQRAEVTKVVFNDPVSAEGELTSMFAGMVNLNEVSDLSKFDTSNATNMASMFADCKSLESIDLSGLDTGNVENISNMFRECYMLSYLDLTSFDTSQVTAMQQTFDSCYALTEIIFSSSFDTSKVEDMDSMFAHCRALKSLDLSGFRTDSIKELDNTFRDCRSLTSLDLSTFSTTTQTAMQEAFEDSNNLVKLTLGADFAFGGGINPYPPSPSGTTSSGFYTGYWLNTTGDLFASSNIPSNIADTYNAQILPVSINITGSNLNIGTSLSAILNNSQGKDFSYQWSRGDSINGPFTVISGATMSIYNVTDSDAGKYLRCTAKYEKIEVSDTAGPIVPDEKKTSPPAVENNNGSDSPDTGDHVDIAATVTVMVLSVIALLYLLLRSQKSL